MRAGYMAISSVRDRQATALQHDALARGEPSMTGTFVPEKVFLMQAMA